MKKAITICFLFFSLASFAQKAESGTYVLRFFDTEYSKFYGRCKAIIKKDSIKVIAIEGCHRMKGELICEGVLRKSKKIKDRWVIVTEKEKDIKYDGDFINKINFKKRFFYSY